MLDWTDRHCRYFHRLLSSEARLYTEMLTTGAIIHGGMHRFLDFDEFEHPVALQLGGSEPADLAECAKLARQWGYDEVNLNCGCPSPSSTASASTRTSPTNSCGTSWARWPTPAARFSSFTHATPG